MHTPPKRTREAQQWAQQMLEDIRRVTRGQSLPFEIPGTIMLKGLATRAKQEVNLAIKKHNIREEELNNARWLEQIAASKKVGATVPPDYEMHRILWILQSRQIDENKDEVGYEPRCILIAALPLGRNRAPGKMERFAREFSIALAGTNEQNVANLKPKQDPFAKWLAVGEPPSGKE